MTKVISHEILRNSLLFKDTSDEVLTEVVKHCRFMELSAGETLFEQDSPSDAFYILEDGQIHVVRNYEGGNNVILATEGPYYVIGELSLLANMPRTGTVVAVSDCDLVMLSREDIQAVCKAHADVSLDALTHLGQRLYRLNLTVRESALGDIAARLGSVILLISDNKAGSVAEEVSTARLARATAINVDYVKQILKQWESKNILTYDGRHLTIHDIEAIRNLAG